MKEIFKRINGYDNYYSVSNTGSIRSERTGRILKPDQHHEYLRVSLSVNGNVKRFFIHRLVCMAFNENPYKSNIVNHIDGNKRNNNANNLEWCTYKENAKHAYDTGLCFSAQKKATEKAKEILKARTKERLVSLLGDRFLSSDVFNDGTRLRSVVVFKCICGNKFRKRIDSKIVKRGGICSDCLG